MVTWEVFLIEWCINVHQGRVILGKRQFNLVREFSSNILFTVSTDRQAITEPGLFVSRF